MPPQEPGKARVLGEFGGLGASVPGHLWKPLEPGKGYQQLTVEQLPQRYAALMQKLQKLQAEGLSASIYTQVSDVEQEQNGLMTYDREVIKIPVGVIARMNAALTSRSGMRRGASATSASIAGFRTLARRDRRGFHPHRAEQSSGANTADGPV
jgi:hypothetical protein